MILSDHFAVILPFFGILANLRFSEAAECSNLNKVNYTSVYTPKGRATFIAGMEAYETGDLNSTKILVAVHDACGFNYSSNMFQICDTLGELGYKVVTADWFHGIPWGSVCPTAEELHQKRVAGLMETSWENSTRADLALLIAEYKEQNNQSEFGIFGFCYGGGISAHAVSEFSEDVKVAGMVHPSFIPTFNISDAELIQRPTLIVAAANDPAALTEYCDIINRNLGNGSCAFNRFNDVDHSFSGGPADWTNATIRGRSEEAMDLFERFLCDHFPPN